MRDSRGSDTGDPDALCDIATKRGGWAKVDLHCRRRLGPTGLDLPGKLPLPGNDIGLREDPLFNLRMARTASSNEVVQVSVRTITVDVVKLKDGDF
jgi:hypothetical protein